MRPTSETVIGEYMAKWVQSYRDLPLLLNQWANVVRWELRPRLFLRTSEFLWQEGHTAHRTRADAAAYARRIHLEVYRDFLVDRLALPVLVGHKTERERFAGAVNTHDLRGHDGRRQGPAAGHQPRAGAELRAGVRDRLPRTRTAQRELAWTTSWGSSTRMVGGLIMGHGDDAGLRLPPAVAPAQVVVLPVRADAALAAGRRAGGGPRCATRACGCGSTRGRAGRSGAA